MPNSAGNEKLGNRKIGFASSQCKPSVFNWPSPAAKAMPTSRVRMTA